jgi:hypothetical protein
MAGHSVPVTVVSADLFKDMLALRIDQEENVRVSNSFSSI